MKLTESFLWRRADQIGLDSARLFRLPDGWRIEGTAVFVHDGRPAHLNYEVGADVRWVVRRARVTGYFGERTVDHSVRVYRQGGWTLNHGSQPGARGCVDFDLGFSPAARVLASRRRSALGPGDGASPVAVLSFADGLLMRLDVLPVPAGAMAVFEAVEPAAAMDEALLHPPDWPPAAALSPRRPGVPAWP